MRVERQVTYKLQVETGSAFRRLVGEPWAHTRPGMERSRAAAELGRDETDTQSPGKITRKPRKETLSSRRGAGRKSCPIIWPVFLPAPATTNRTENRLG